jgi:alkylation response protein AidB-like acyl-CoA dehydrogenase
MALPQRQYHVINSPHLGNQFIEDSALRSYLGYLLPQHLAPAFASQLEAWGDRCVGKGDLQRLGDDANSNPATLKQYDAWGNRIDVINTAYGYKRMKEITAEEGLTALPYARPYGDYSRLLQFAKVYLLSGAQGINYTCNTGMADGAARIIQQQLSHNTTLRPNVREMLKDVYRHLTSRDPREFWDSGQWMTEKTGGSDVSGSETIARLQPDGTYLLSGFKFFTSGTNSDISMVLARIAEPGEDESQIRKKKLSLFVVKLRDAEGKLNGIVIHKMKNKMGTKAMPTVELEMIRTPGILVSEPGKGVAGISPLLNISRVGVSFLSVGMMRRALAVCRDYAHRRSVFGALLSRQPLHLHILAALEMEFRGCLLFSLQSVKYLGMSENKNPDPFVMDLFRVLAPLVKLYPCKTAVAFISEAMECMGGTGYMEDSRFPWLLADAQAVAIWEGTTNVCTMDVVRAIRTNPKCLSAYVSDCTRLLTEAKTALQADKDNAYQPRLLQANQKLTSALDEILFAKFAFGEQTNVLSVMRHFTFGLARIYIGCLLLHFAATCKGSNGGTVSKIDYVTAIRWANRTLFENPLASQYKGDVKQLEEEDRVLALDVDDDGKARGCGDVCPVTGKKRAKY